MSLNKTVCSRCSKCFCNEQILYCKEHPKKLDLLTGNEDEYETCNKIRSSQGGYICSDYSSSWNFGLINKYNLLTDDDKIAILGIIMVILGASSLVILFTVKVF